MRMSLRGRPTLQPVRAMRRSSLVVGLVMVDDQRVRWLMGLASCFVWLAVLRSAGWAQQPPSQESLPRSQAVQALPPQAPGKFSTPRETLKTLYFSIIAYDFHPALIDDAVACLEQSPDQPRDVGEMARLAIELDAILQELSFP